MKKILIPLAFIAMLLLACNNDSNEQAEQNQVDMSDFFLYTDTADELNRLPQNMDGKYCSTMTNLNRLLDEDPKLYKRMYDIEHFTRSKTAYYKPGNGNGNGNGGNGGGGSGGGGGTTDNLGVVTIPVYVHVIYSNNNENISEAQINSQINVLNDDFRRTNNDANQTPSDFSGVAADSEIQFTLAGITRKSSSRTSWGTNDAMKFASNGGVDVVDPSNVLNIWVCNIGGGILGYAQFPGGSSSTDGVVVSPQYFGTQGYVSAPFDEGRTTTHEVGHYLNLRHIWGDGRCKRDDFVSDTPSSDRPNYGCPGSNTVITNCRTRDMHMNYMDYTDDACMNMFSEGQKARMRAVFLAGGPRESMVN